MTVYVHTVGRFQQKHVRNLTYFYYFVLLYCPLLKFKNIFPNTEKLSSHTDNTEIHYISADISY